MLEPMAAQYLFNAARTAKSRMGADITAQGKEVMHEKSCGHPRHAAVRRLRVLR